jgi:hypothetical protein
MMKEFTNVDSNSSAGTDAQSSNSVEACSVSQNGTKPNVVCSFLVGTKLKLVKKAYWMQNARKGQIGTILKTAISINKPCYWVEFKGGKEWWMEEQVVSA